MLKTYFDRLRTVVQAVPLRNPEAVALIYQTSVETSAGSGVKIILRQSPREIHEMCVSGQFWCINECVLINLASENNHRGLAGQESTLYDLQVREEKTRDKESRVSNSTSERKSLLQSAALVWITVLQMMFKYLIYSLHPQHISSIA